MKHSFLKKMTIAVLLLFSFGLVTADLAYARSSGGGRSSSGGSRSSGFSGGGSKASTPASKPSASSGFKGGNKAPAAAPAPKAPAADASSASKSSGFSGGNKDKAVTKPDAAASKAAAANQKSTKPTQTAMQKQQDRAAAKAKSAKALENTKAEKAKFAANPASSVNKDTLKQSPLGSKFASSNSSGKATGGGNTYITKNTYYNQRDDHYRGWERPSYIYNYPASSSNGVFDFLIMWSMLDHMNDSNNHDSDYYYHHQNDPEVKEWKKNAEKEAENNAKVREQLAALEQKVKDNEAKGIARDESYLPPEGAAVVLTPEAAEQLLPDDVEEPADSEVATEVAPEKSKSHWLLWTFIIVIIGGGLVFIVSNSKKK